MIFLAIGFIFIGLNASVWRDAPPRVYGFTLDGVWLLPLVVLMCIRYSLEKRGVDMGLEQGSAAEKRVRTFEEIILIIYGLIAVTFIVTGIVSRNGALSAIGGGVLALATWMYIASVIAERAERREKDEKTDVEGAEE